MDVSDLVVLKVLAARAKDLDDVSTLLRIHADHIDETRVRELLTMLEGALGQSDLLSVFERLCGLRRSATAERVPHGGARDRRGWLR